MAIVNGIALESNKKFRVNFNGGQLTSDSGLLLLKEFYYKFGLEELIQEEFHTSDCKCYYKSEPKRREMLMNI